MDRRCPNWINEIDVELLDLSNASSCVLGQSAYCLVQQPAPSPWPLDYGYVVNEFWPNASHVTATRLGFNVPEPNRQKGGIAAYEMLTIAWRELIRERRGL